MNVIISNKYKDMLVNLDIEVIKNLNGEFSVDELIGTFQNFFFNKMILDITAIQNYTDIKTIQKLSVSLDMSKIILLLDGSPERTSPDYLSKLISMGIYNFTTDVGGIMYLYNNPNSYRDVAQYHQLDNPVPEQSVNGQPTQQIITRYETVQQGRRVIGIKSVTAHSGATTLTYMMKKQLEKHYSVVAIETDKRDFTYYKDNNLVSVGSNDIGNMVAKYSDKDVVLIDINNSLVAENMCQQVIYLIEPSIIKLNKLLTIKPKTIEELKNKTIVLCPTILNSKDISDFEYESKLKVFFSLPFVDDHKRSSEVDQFLYKLGFSRQQLD